MNNKIISIIFLSVLAYLLMASLVSATDIAYVVKYSSNPEKYTSITNILTSLNYTYNLIDDSKISSTNFSSYKMILLGDESIYNVPVNAHSSLIINPRYYLDWSRDRGSIGKDTAYVFDEDSEIASEIPRTFLVYTESSLPLSLYYLYGTKYSNDPIITIGSSSGDRVKYVLAVKENPRRVFFGIPESEFWTADTKKLFENSILWIINGQSENAPVFNGPIPNIEWKDGEFYDLNLSNYFTDPNNKSLTFGVEDTSSNQDVLVEILGSIVKFSSTPNWTGQDWIIFNAYNGQLSTITNRIILNVLEADPPVINPGNPILAPIGNKIITEGNLLQFTITATDSNQTSLTFLTDALPEGAIFTDNLDNTALFSWNTTTNQAGIYYVNFSVKDEENLTASERVRITVQDYIAPPSPPNFSDVNLCSNITSELVLSIKDPDNNDDFTVGETINGKIKIENNANEDLSVDIEAHLYDLSTDESIESADDSINVDESDSEDYDFNIDVPSDAKDKDNFVLLAIARADSGDSNKEYCNYKYVNINIDREKNRIVINDIEKTPEIVSPGGNLEVKVEVENVGSKDQDIYIELENSELEISEKSEEFKLEKSGDDNKDKKTIMIAIPSDTEEGDYILTARVFSGTDEMDSKDITISIMDSGSSGNERVNNVQASASSTNNENLIFKNNLISLKNPSQQKKPASASKISNAKASSSKTKSVLNNFSFDFGLKNKNDQMYLIIDLLISIGIVFEIILALLFSNKKM
ncbi:MAG: putative Ig domain-containing protein [Nanoarchaeota archaeon]